MGQASEAGGTAPGAPEHPARVGAAGLSLRNAVNASRRAVLLVVFIRMESTSAAGGNSPMLCSSTACHL